MRPQVENLPGSPDSLTVAQLADYVQRQLQNLASSVTGLYEGEGEVATVAPPKPRESMYKWADGTNWNPAGVGKGPVMYDGSAWRPLYSTAAMLLTAIKTVDGAGSGLDADLLDGNDSSFFLPASSYTAADILTKIKTVDGAGSGLDADTLDALDSSYFLNAGNLSAGTLLAARMPALTGDVTTTVGTVATTIGANKVTLSMLATLATGNVLGRNTAGTGNVEALPFDVNATGFAIAKRDVNGNLYGGAFIANNGVIYLNGALTRYLYFNGSYYELSGAETGVGDGSTSRPGLMFLADTNTGLRRVTTDKMAFVTAGFDRLTCDASGQWGVGIDPTSRNNCNFQLGNSIGFPATQVASSDVNALDDYEEGTFTGTITAASGTFTTVSGGGEYTKIGNRVLWFYELTITTNGTAAGYIIVSGFPFTFGNNHEGNGRESAALGWMLQAEGNAMGSSIIIIKWDNSFPTDGNNGRLIRVNGQHRV